MGAKLDTPHPTSLRSATFCHKGRSIQHPLTAKIQLSVEPRWKPRLPVAGSQSWIGATFQPQLESGYDCEESIFSTDAKALGERLRRMRKRISHLSQEALGSSVSLTGQQISKYERGESSISVELFDRIKKITDELAGGTSTEALALPSGFAEDQKVYEAPPSIKAEALTLLQKIADDIKLGMERLQRL